MGKTGVGCFFLVLLLGFIAAMSLLLFNCQFILSAIRRPLAALRDVYTLEPSVRHVDKRRLAPFCQAIAKCLIKK